MRQFIKIVWFSILLLEVSFVYCENSISVDSYFPIPEQQYRNLKAEQFSSVNTEVRIAFQKYDPSGQLVFQASRNPLAKNATNFPIAGSIPFTSDGNVYSALFKPLTIADLTQPNQPLNVPFGNKEIITNAIENVEFLSDGSTNPDGSVRGISTWPGMGTCEEVNGQFYIGMYQANCGDSAYLAWLNESSGFYVAAGVGMGWASPLSALGMGVVGIKMGTIDYKCCRLQENRPIPQGENLQDCRPLANQVQQISDQIKGYYDGYYDAFNDAWNRGCFRTTNPPALIKTYTHGARTGQWRGCDRYTWACQTPQCQGACTTCNTCTYTETITHTGPDASCGCAAYNSCDYPCTQWAWGENDCGNCGNYCSLYWCNWCWQGIFYLPNCAVCGTGACAQWSCNSCWYSYTGTCNGPHSSCGCGTYNSCSHSHTSTVTNANCTQCGCAAYSQVCCPNPGEGNVTNGWNWTITDDGCGVGNKPQCEADIAILDGNTSGLDALKQAYFDAKQALCNCACQGSPQMASCVNSCFEGMRE